MSPGASRVAHLHAPPPAGSRAAPAGLAWPTWLAWPGWPGLASSRHCRRRRGGRASGGRDACGGARRTQHAWNSEPVPTAPSVASQQHCDRGPSEAEAPPSKPATSKGGRRPPQHVLPRRGKELEPPLAWGSRPRRPGGLGTTRGGWRRQRPRGGGGRGGRRGVTPQQPGLSRRHLLLRIGDQRAIVGRAVGSQHRQGRLEAQPGAAGVVPPPAAATHHSRR